MPESTATVQVRHLGGDRLSIRARGHELQADQPVEGGGENTAPTPTELFLGSLAARVAPPVTGDEILDRRNPNLRRPERSWKTAEVLP